MPGQGSLARRKASGSGRPSSRKNASHLLDDYSDHEEDYNNVQKEPRPRSKSASGKSKKSGSSKSKKSGSKSKSKSAYFNMPSDASIVLQRAGGFITRKSLKKNQADALKDLFLPAACGALADVACAGVPVPQRCDDACELQVLDDTLEMEETFDDILDTELSLDGNNNDSKDKNDKGESKGDKVGQTITIPTSSGAVPVPQTGQQGEITRVINDLEMIAYNPGEVIDVDQDAAKGRLLSALARVESKAKANAAKKDGKEGGLAKKFGLSKILPKGKSSKPDNNNAAVSQQKIETPDCTVLVSRNASATPFSGANADFNADVKASQELQKKRGQQQLKTMEADLSKTKKELGKARESVTKVKDDSKDSLLKLAVVSKQLQSVSQERDEALTAVVSIKAENEVCLGKVHTALDTLKKAGTNLAETVQQRDEARRLVAASKAVQEQAEIEARAERAASAKVVEELRKENEGLKIQLKKAELAVMVSKNKKEKKEKKESKKNKKKDKTTQQRIEIDSKISELSTVMSALENSKKELDKKPKKTIFGRRKKMSPKEEMNMVMQSMELANRHLTTLQEDESSILAELTDAEKKENEAKKKRNWFDEDGYLRCCLPVDV